MEQLEYEAEMLEEADWAPSRERGLWRDAFRALRRNRMAVVAIVILAILVVLSLSTDFTQFIARYSYRDQVYS